MGATYKKNWNKHQKLKIAESVYFTQFPSKISIARLVAQYLGS